MVCSSPSMRKGRECGRAGGRVGKGGETWGNGTRPVRWDIQSLQSSSPMPLLPGPCSVPLPLKVLPNFPLPCQQLGELSHLGKCFLCRGKGMGPTYIHSREPASMELKSPGFLSSYIF